ncbi:hypothetical protein [Bartonella henselae]|uniref:hypothetical protein n=1 Tax=Bartonella henselae TaxID=38323 RepID=UPI000964CEF8|nr:hypothetical protein [Bartonella henselae]OLL38353.1 hypothetical protein AT244_07805 [Bartonella henselae]OLL46853.1 hypothetical protein AT245_05795 [Bartonella henselae]
MSLGIVTKESNLTLKNIVLHAFSILEADDHSQITISGGSFDRGIEGIYVLNGSTITIKDNAKITTYIDIGLLADGSQSEITMTGGTVSGAFSALSAENGDHIDIKDVAITTIDENDNGYSVYSNGTGSIITLHGNTTIKNVSTGLVVNKDGIIKMTGGSIMAYINGTNFSGNKKDENKLKDVIISSYNDDTLLHERMYVAYNSKLSLENVTITQAEDGIFAKSNSQVTVSERLVSTKTTRVYTESGSVITVKDKAEIISSNGSGLHANGRQSKIKMIEGTVNAKKGALYTDNGEDIDITNVSATAKIGGLQFMSLLYIIPDELNDPQNYQNSEINLTNTKIHVDNGTGFSLKLLLIIPLEIL